MIARTHAKTRRILLSASAGLAVSSFFGLSSRSFATIEEVEAAIDFYTAGGDVTDGGVSLHLPEIAENGHSVAVTVSVDSPMTEQSHAQSVMLFATSNPNPEVALFTFSLASGLAKVSTRMRLAESQDVIAIAKMSDGSFKRDQQFVHVTIGGCGA